jgi:Tat-targeted selenate reductase subunit YnfE
LPSYDDLKKMGIYKRKDPAGHYVAYKKFRDDPQANPLKTPSGKIEIYSSRLARIANTWEIPRGSDQSVTGLCLDARRLGRPGA